MVENFENKLNEFAHLLVEIGMNVQKGQTPRISSPIECAPLARKCVAACYECGAKEVIMEWSDDFITRQKYLYADETVFGEYPSFMKSKLDWLLERNAPVLSIIGADPEMLKGIDPNRIQTWQRTAGQPTKAFYDAMTAGQFQWSIGAHPTKAWAEKVFPALKGEDAIDALWDAIFKVCRITGDGKAVERWKEHIEATARRANMLNEYNFKTLHYTNSLGTDLVITLPENHIWAGGSEKSKSGVEFVANIPTEEIFTAPQYDGVNGRVYSAMPLALDGNLVDRFYMEFKDGKIVGLHADIGEEYLKRSTTVDEGSSYLGEVALVPFDSPIRNTEILFYNTLFDENASCHLAYGSAYPTCVNGGEMLDEDEQKKLGLNQSITHIDFMVGTADLSIIGTTHDGKDIPVFIDGNFAF
ncbi:MAG: aminopeptidase [Clostridia bacterium]|nr:aminopeptidase [Clostridia bacterium]